MHFIFGQLMCPRVLVYWYRTKFGCVSKIRASQPFYLSSLGKRFSPLHTNLNSCQFTDLVASHKRVIHQRITLIGCCVTDVCILARKHGSRLMSSSNLFITCIVEFYLRVICFVIGDSGSSTDSGLFGFICICYTLKRVKELLIQIPLCLYAHFLF